MKRFPGKVGLIQRVLPAYRAPFFDALASACQGGLGVFAGSPRPAEMIHTAEALNQARLTHGFNLHLFSSRTYLCLQFGLLRWLRDWNPEVLIVEANPRYLRTPAAVRWMHRRGRQVIGWGLGAPPLSGPLALLRCQRRARFIQGFDALITYSRTGAEEYAQLGFPPDRILTAVNAITPPPAHPLPDRPPLVNGQRARALFVGRLQTRKRVGQLLKTCAALPQELQPELVIVGDGPDRPRLESLAADVYPRGAFTGALFDDDLAAQFRAADLFVLPGTGGLAVQQAMSYGLPIIAAEADGTQADLVRPGNGWQVPPSDPDALHSALLTALSDVPRLRQMGAESYRIVAEEVNLEQMVHVFIEAIQRSAA